MQKREYRWLRSGMWLMAGVSIGGPALGQAPVPPPAAAPVTAPATPAVPQTAPAAPTFFVPRVATHTETDAQGKTFAILTIDETEAASFRVAAGGFTPEQRADVAAQRLTSLLSAGLRPDEIIAEPDVKPAWRVAARGGTLLLATPDDGIAHKTTPKALALSWLKTLQTLLAEPPLTLSAKSLVVPLGETRTVTVGGSVLPTDVQAKDQNAAVGQSAYDPIRRTLTIHGKAVGSDIVTVAPAPGVGGPPLLLPVRVMQYAGVAAGTITVEVTGDPAPHDLVAQAAYLGLTQALDLQSGARVDLLDTPRNFRDLAPNAQITASFPVRLAGPNLLPVDAKPVVTVLDAHIQSPPPSELLYSNDPEQVKHAGSLFSANIAAGSTVRLDFHHQNVSADVLTFHVDLVNTSAVPSSVQVISGISLPGADTVQVGRRAGAAFLNNLNGNIGLVMTVPPHGSVPLVTQRFAPGLTLSGIMQIQCVSGNPLALKIRAAGDVDTVASPLWQLYMARDGGNAVGAPSDSPVLLDNSPASADIYPSPQISLTGRYSVDGRWAFIPFGDKNALRSTAGAPRLFGNYGADYDVTLTLVNPTAAPRTVGIYFAPAAGLTAGIFQVDNGPLIEYDPFQPPDERQVALEPLAPGETRVVHLRTIGLNGSSYPAEIVARVVDKPTPPPAPPATPAAPPAATISAAVTGKDDH